MTNGDILLEVQNELKRAEKKFAQFNNPHEGYAVLLEEMDELWDLIKKQSHDREAMKWEALQVAAMAVRFIKDLCP